MFGKIMRLFLLFFFVLYSATPIFAMEKISVDIKEINGLKYYFIKAKTASGKIQIHLIQIDPQKYDIELALADNKIGYSATLSDIVKINPNTVTAINGTFFTLSYPPLPISNIMIDSKMIYLNNLHRTACGITKNNELFFDIPKIKGLITIEGNKNYFYIWGMNRPRKYNEVIVYTSEYGEKTNTNASGIEVTVENNEITKITEGNSPIPENGFVISLNNKSKKIADWLPIGTKINIQFNLKDKWQTAEQIFTGGPRLLKDEKIVVSEAIKEENFRGYLLNLNPRTTIGKTKNGKILLAVVDGRQLKSIGLPYNELAHIMSDLGAVDAMGLDGGNSSMMWLAPSNNLEFGKIVNSPSAGEQKIVNAIIVIKKTDQK